MNARGAQRRAWSLGLGALLCVVVNSGCNCDPGEIDVSPTCPGGRPASATVNVVGELADIRHVGTDKQIRVRGERATTASQCFGAGGELDARVILEGQRQATLSTGPLAHGAWEFTVIPLSGGDHPELPPLTITLSPGVTYTLSVSANADGDLQAIISP